MHAPDLTALDQRTERTATWIVAVGLAAVLAGVLSAVQCSRPPPQSPAWPPPPAVVDALPAQVTPTLAESATVAAASAATPAADPSPVTVTALLRTGTL